MGVLRNKSDANIAAAGLLIKQDENYYAASVHCSYYGCFQYLKYTIKTYFNQSYEEIEKQCLNYLGGTHGYVNDTVMDRLRFVVDFNTHRTAKRELSDLKQFRIDSDYFNKEITDVEATKSLSLSEGIIRLVKKNLHK